MREARRKSFRIDDAGQRFSKENLLCPFDVLLIEASISLAKTEIIKQSLGMFSVNKLLDIWRDINRAKHKIFRCILNKCVSNVNHFQQIKVVSLPEKY